jgi:hypothetical protein
MSNSALTSKSLIENGGTNVVSFFYFDFPRSSVFFRLVFLHLVFFLSFFFGFLFTSGFMFF